MSDGRPRSGHELEQVSAGIRKGVIADLEHGIGHEVVIHEATRKLNVGGLILRHILSPSFSNTGSAPADGELLTYIHTEPSGAAASPSIV